MNDVAENEDDSGEDSGTPVVSVKVTDILGLSKPLKKMVDYLASGLGIVYEPTRKRRDAQADADTIRTIADAVKDVSHLPVQVGYKGESLQLLFDKPTIDVEPLTIEQRAFQTTVCKQVQQQKNIEAVLAVAAGELADETHVPDVAPDADWSTRFFDYAGKVSSEQMQDLWGRIFAGKIKHPESFSLRTLDFVRSMSKGEAEMFSLAANLSVMVATGKVFVLTDLIGPKKKISFDAAISLGAIGLLSEESGLMMDIKIEDGHDDYVFIVGSKVIKQTNKTDRQVKQTIRVRPFTNTGVELLGLVIRDSEVSIVKELVARLNLRDCILEIGDAHLQADGSYLYENMKEYSEDDVRQLLTTPSVAASNDGDASTTNGDGRLN